MLLLRRRRLLREGVIEYGIYSARQRSGSGSASYVVG